MRHRLAMLVAAVGLLISGASASVDSVRAAPAEPVWPSPELVDGVRGLLTGFYGQRLAPNAPYYRRAPEWESDKAPSAKDPDSLWELRGGPGTACHPAASDAQFISCTGKRLARTVGWTYFGGLPLFDPARDYYANEGVIHLAAYFALYHVFVHDFDAPVDAAYVPGPDPAIRNNKRYHAAMIRAYETHMRDALLRLFRDTRNSYTMQADFTRSVGGLTTSYVRTVQAVEETDAWASPQERANALALVAGLVQRGWWEWMAPQPEGPRTAGWAPFGSQADYDQARAQSSSWDGTDYFVINGQVVPSLRPDYMNVGPYAGLAFDADFALPGDWYCNSRFAAGSPEHATCKAHAALAAKNGSKTPFGQYYATDATCAVRTANGAVSPFSCGVTNMGSIAEEWMWTHVGTRLGAALLKDLSLPPSDPNAKSRRIGLLTYDRITERLGYGVSGWHGGAGEHDEMEWALHPDTAVRAIRTLSGARHDGEPQDGRFSVGENDVSPASSAIVGDTWPANRQEFPAAMENHVPGPNALYGSLLFAYVLADKPAEGPSPSLYDTVHRNNVTEFNSWIWLMLSSFHRCPPGDDDPAAGGCFAYDEAHFPYPATVNRVPLFAAADGPDPVATRYLWRNPGLALSGDSIAQARSTCRAEPGIPWRPLYDRDTSGPSEFLIDEGGFGAFNEQLQANAGLMKMVAARYNLDAPDPGEQAEFELHRSEVLAPWYASAHDQVAGILDLYGIAYGYIPDVENSSCVGTDPEPGNPTRTVHSWQYGTWDSASAVTVRRAMWYSVAALWYWQYDTDWLDIDASEWQ